MEPFRNSPFNILNQDHYAHYTGEEPLFQQKNLGSQQKKQFSKKEIVQIAEWQFSSYDVSLLFSQTLQGIVRSHTTNKTFHVEFTAPFAKLSPEELIQSEIKKNFYVRMFFSNEEPCRLEFDVRGEGGVKGLFYFPRELPLNLIPRGNAALNSIPQTPQEIAWVMRHREAKKEDRDWCVTIARKFINKFTVEASHSDEDINDLVTFVLLDDPKLTRDIIALLINKIDTKNNHLLKLELVHALALAVDRANPSHFNPDDLYQLTLALMERLKTTHNTEISQQELFSALILILNAMVDADMKGVYREKHEQLKRELKTLQDATPFASIYSLTAYALEALRRIPDNETKMARFLRNATGIGMGIFYFSAAVYKIDPKHLVDGFYALKDNLAGLKEFAKEIKDKLSLAIPDLLFGMQELQQSGILSKWKELSWYDEIRYVELLIKSNAFCALEQFLRDIRLHKEPSFFYALVLKLNEIVLTHPNLEIKKETIMLLRDLYRQDEVWHPNIDLKDSDFQNTGRNSTSWVWVSIKAAIISQLALYQQIPNLQSQASQTLKLIIDSADTAESEFIEQFSKSSLESATQISAAASLFSSIVKDDIEMKIEKMRASLVNDPAFQRTNSFYVPLMGAGSVQDLQAMVSHFRKSNLRVLLLKGDPGAGKTLFCQRLAHSIWENYRPHSGVIPLYVSLPTLKNPTQELISEALEPFEMTSREIKSRKLVLILDGLDELPLGSELLKMNRLLDYDAQVIVACRTQARHSEKLLTPTTGGFHSIEITPFSPSQIDEFIATSISLGGVRWKSVKRYRDEIDNIPGLNELITNPFILKIVIDVLPTIVEQQLKSSPSHPQTLTRFDLYQTFIDAWFENECERNKTKFVELHKKWGITPDNFKKEALKNCIALANAFSNANKTYVPYSWSNAPEPIRKLLNDPRSAFLRSLSPLHTTVEGVSFIHKSLLDHFVSAGTEELLDAFEKKRRAELEIKEGKLEHTDDSSSQKFYESPFYKTLLEPSIWQDQAEKARYDQNRQEELLDIVKKSKKDPQMAIAAANAISILNLAHVSFAGKDFRGIRVPGACLERAVLAGTNLRGSDLSDVNLTDAVLINTKIEGTIMEGVKFGQLPMIDLKIRGSLWHKNKIILSENKQWLICQLNLYPTIIEIETGQLLKTFPAASYFTLFDKDKYLISANKWGSPISIWDIESEEKVLEFVGHSDDVTAIVFLESEKKLVTASEDKTIRIWDLTTGKQLKSLWSWWQSPFTSLIALKGGQFLASGNEKGNIQIWETSTGKEIKLLKGHTSNVKVLKISEDEERLISADTEEIRIWDISSPDPNSWKFEKKVKPEYTLGPLVLDNGNKFAVYNCNNLFIKDIRTENPVQTLSIANIQPFSLTELEPGKRLAAHGNDSKTIRFFDLQTSDKLKKRATELSATRKDLPQNNTFISGFHNTQWTWDSITGQLLNKEYIEHKKDIKINAKREVRYENNDLDIVLWDLEKKTEVRRFKGDSSHGIIVRIATEKIIITTHYDAGMLGEEFTLQVWDTDSGKQIGCIKWQDSHFHNRDPVPTMQYSSERCSWQDTVLLRNDFQLVMVPHSPYGTKDVDTIQLWNVNSERKPKILFKDPKNNCTALTLLGKDKAAFYAGESIRIFDLNSQKQLYQLEGDYLTERHLIPFDEGRKLISYSFTEIRFWDVCEGKKLASLKCSWTGDNLIFVEYPQQNLMIIADEHIVRLWNYESNHEVGKIILPLQITDLELRPANDHVLIFATVRSRGIWCWKLTQEDNRYKTTFLWTNDPYLICTGMKVGNMIQGLSPRNKRLLLQYGAIEIEQDQHGNHNKKDKRSLSL